MAVLTHSQFGDAWIITIDHDPRVTATDCPKNSIIINDCWWRKMDDGETTNVKQIIMGEYDLTTDPTKDSDSDNGHCMGDEWFNTNNDKLWKCIDNTNGAARWMNLADGTIVGGP